MDDNVGAARLLATLLGKLGPHTVAVAHDGPTAVAKVPEFLPDVVLLDIGLPGMDGFEVGRAIRQLEAGRAVKLIAVTGYGQEEDRRKSFEAGFDDHLVKPVSFDTLSKMFAKRLDQQVVNQQSEPAGS
jgi:CheY-like chemotaxis protein